VTVTAGNGSKIAVGNYSYFGVTGLNTTSGPSGGGTAVAIHGTGFTDVTAVVFGTMPAASFTVVSPTELDAVAPPGVGTVDVQVINGLAPSATVTADYFSYTGGPAGSSSITQGTGGGATVFLADQISTNCANSFQYIDIGQGKLCNGAQFITNNFGPTGAIESAFITGALVTGAGAAITLVAPAALADLAPIVVAAAPVVAGLIVGYLIWKTFIDPSGTIIDTNGNPVGGATATLLGQAPGGGPFSPVDPANGTIEPATNPQTTSKTAPSTGTPWREPTKSRHPRPAATHPVTLPSRTCPPRRSRFPRPPSGSCLHCSAQSNRCHRCRP
jgi:hypothetical protein